MYAVSVANFQPKLSNSAPYPVSISEEERYSAISVVCRFDYTSAKFWIFGFEKILPPYLVEKFATALGNSPFFVSLGRNGYRWKIVRTQIFKKIFFSVSSWSRKILASVDLFRVVRSRLLPRFPGRPYPWTLASVMIDKIENIRKIFFGEYEYVRRRVSVRVLFAKKFRRSPLDSPGLRNQPGSECFRLSWKSITRHSVRGKLFETMVFLCLRLLMGVR